MELNGKKVMVVDQPVPDEGGIVRFDYSIFEKEKRGQGTYDMNTCELTTPDCGYSGFGVVMNMVMTLQEAYSEEPCYLMTEDKPCYIGRYAEVIQTTLGIKLDFPHRAKMWDGSDEVILSGELDQWLRALALEHRELAEKMTQEDMAQDEFQKDFLTLLVEMDQYYKRIYPFESMFYDFLQNGSKREYRAAVEQLRKLADDNKEEGSIIEKAFYSWDITSRKVTHNIYFKQLASMTDVYDAASIERFSANAEKNMEQAQADIQSIYGKLGGAEINFAVPDTSKKSGSKSKSEKDTTKEFDWIEQAIENVEKEVKSLDDVVNSAYLTFSQKNEALAKEIGKVSEEIDLQQQAYEGYMRKADSIGLSDHYKELVQSGAINIEEIKDENLQKQIDAYQKWYDKAQNASDAIKQLKTDMKDLYVDAYELQTDNLKERLDSDSITQKQYLEGLKAAYEQFYGNLEDYAQQYHEAVLEYLDEEKGYLNDVAGAAALRRFTNNTKRNDEEDSKRTINYLKWTKTKTDIIDVKY